MRILSHCVCCACVWGTAADQSMVACWGSSNSNRGRDRSHEHEACCMHKHTRMHTVNREIHCSVPNKNTEFFFLLLLFILYDFGLVCELFCFLFFIFLPTCRRHFWLAAEKSGLSFAQRLFSATCHKHRNMEYVYVEFGIRPNVNNWAGRTLALCHVVDVME